MNYNFFSSIMVRTPLFSFQEYRNINYSSMLKNETFKAALFLASKSFFDELEKKQFDFEALTEKQKHTVIKYINRASFRSTPFGLFSAFSLVKWAAHPELKITIHSKLTPYIKLDYVILVKLWEKFLKDQNRESVKFYPNQTLFFSDMDIRYIKADIDEIDQTHFSVVSIAKNPALKKLLKFCISGKSFEEMHSFLLKEAEVAPAMAEEFIGELSDQQIIVANNQPNITGEDYAALFFRHLAKDFKCIETSVLGDILKPLLENFPEVPPLLSKIAKQLSKNLLPDKELNFFYSVAEGSIENGGMPDKYQTQIREGLHCLSCLQVPSTIPELDKFREIFKSKYESQEVPLLHVLDSQFGIGYGEFANIKNNYSFLNTSTRESEGEHTKDNDRRKDLAALLLNEWHFSDSYNKDYEIEITDHHLKNTRPEKEGVKFPPSLSVMFRTMDDDIFIEHAGGCSAISLLGRFTCSKKVYDFAKEIACKEQNLNKSVVFAEITHVCNLHSANINRRDHIRKFEIPVLTNSIMERDKQIQLNDIMVSVVHDTVVLRSKKLRKNIIPRLSSAYNYTKNCFPVFRFLCDVQRQHLMSDLSFSLSALIPGLKFYPRIRYKSCILQMAEWHFKESELNFLQNKDSYEAWALFKGFAKANNLPRYFAYTQYDNFLVFDQENRDEITLFLKEIRNKEVVILKEFPFIGKKSLVEDEFQRPLLSQYVASMYLTEAVYKAGTTHKNKKNFLRETREPGDWLYFKIYCHQLSADNILCNYLFPLIRKHTRDGNIKEWFWVRYQDPEYHIRLRIKLTQNEHGRIFEVFNACLNKLCFVKLVQHFHTDIYRREIDRYSGELISYVESVFHSSSNLVAGLLKRKYALRWGEERDIVEVVLSVHEIVVAFEFDRKHNIDFCKMQFDGFFREFGRPRIIKAEMEKFHKKMHSEILVGCSRKTNKASNRLLQKSITSLREEFKNKKVKTVSIEKLAADLIHMHINRFFNHDQRYLEMVVYYMLYRSLTVGMHKTHSIS